MRVGRTFPNVHRKERGCCSRKQSQCTKIKTKHYLLSGKMQENATVLRRKRNREMASKSST